jgi:hypothetical protein
MGALSMRMPRAHKALKVREDMLPHAFAYYRIRLFKCDTRSFGSIGLDMRLKLMHAVARISAEMISKAPVGHCVPTALSVTWVL